MNCQKAAENDVIVLMSRPNSPNLDADYDRMGLRSFKIAVVLSQNRYFISNGRNSPIILPGQRKPPAGCDTICLSEMTV